MPLSYLPIIELDTVDSTNNYAMQLIDANKAQQGMTIVTQSQSAGKGQRGKVWLDAPGQSLLMSIIILPNAEISAQFVFNASVAVAIADVLEKMHQEWQIHIKWPNDIIVNDKKAGGILIENLLRGSRWTHSVIGLGLNVKQPVFPEGLPFATSLQIASGNNIDIEKLRDDIRENIIMTVLNAPSSAKTIARYNEYLYKHNQKQAFTDGNTQWQATILNAHTDGTLEVRLDDSTNVFYHHGQVLWDWGG